jgi:hypothetical protein
MNSSELYRRADHFPRLAARAGRHVMDLLEPDIRQNCVDPAMFLVDDGGSPGRVQTVTMSLDAITSSRLGHASLRRSLQLRGLLPFVEAGYKIAFGGEGEDGRPARGLTVHIRPSWATGSWLSPDNKPTETLSREQLQTDLNTILGVVPEQQIESLDARSKLAGPEARPLLAYFDRLLQHRPNGDYKWEHLSSAGSLTMVASKEPRHLRGTARYEPAASEQRGAFMLRWVSSGRRREYYNPSGVQLLYPQGGPLGPLNVASYLQLPGDTPLELYPSARQEVIHYLMQGVTPESEVSAF